MNLLINGFLVTTPSIVKYSFKMFLQMKVVVFCLGLYTTTLKALSCQRCIESGQLASSAGVFFERAIWSQKCHVETSLREEEMGRVKGGGGGEKINFFLSSPSPLSFFRPRTYRKGYYFYSPQSSTVIKSKMAATTILRTRTRFRLPKIRLHCRLLVN